MNLHTTKQAVFVHVMHVLVHALAFPVLAHVQVEVSDE
jgi:hypothetical protein